jgi:hypothetical protein
MESLNHESSHTTCGVKNIYEIYLKVVTPNIFIGGPVMVRLYYTHHDPEFIEGSEFAWIPAKSMRE